MFFNGYENPKLAAIRLIRSQGCCGGFQQSKQHIQQPYSGELEGLLRYKQQLQSKVAHQRSKMSDIPCAVQLAQQIQELQQIIQGLSRQNRQRMRLMQTAVKQATSTQTTQLQDDEQDARQNQRLQAQYNSLMKKLEKTNDRNSMLVNKLINM